MLTQQGLNSLRGELSGAAKDAFEYFDRVAKYIKPEAGFHPFGGEGLWADVAADDREFAQRLSQQVKHLIVKASAAAKASPLIEDVDLRELRVNMKRMLAALRFRWYEYHPPYAISEEDRVYGVQPASEREELLWDVGSARNQFRDGYDSVVSQLDLLSPGEDRFAAAIAASQGTVVRKYRPNTAFIIMRMGGVYPEDEDVKNCFKKVFNEFGIKAVRADDIEHQDVITQRILDEISTSEFLIADLTGERPSVYYEVGYAHALGKRPILYRKKGTALHFDLAVHNVPEYENLTDLENKLRKRLSAITSKVIEEQT